MNALDEENFQKAVYSFVSKDPIGETQPMSEVSSRPISELVAAVVTFMWENGSGWGNKPDVPPGTTFAQFKAAIDQSLIPPATAKAPDETNDFVGTLGSIGNVASISKVKNID